MSTRGIVASAVAVAALAVGGAAAAQSGRSEGRTVTVKSTEFKFVLSKRTLPKGKVTFVVRNVGKLPHDFSIAGKKSAVIKPGKTARLVVRFTRAKKYAYKCTVPGHAAAGMKGTLRVR